MKKILFLVFFVFGNLLVSQAQPSKEMHDAAVIFASEYCNCIKPFMQQLDQEVLTTLILFPEDEEAAEEYIAGIDPGVFLRLEEQLSSLESFENSDEFNVCMTRIEEKMERFQDKIEAVFLEDPLFMNTVLEELENSSHCQLARLFLMWGLKE